MWRAERERKPQAQRLLCFSPAHMPYHIDSSRLGQSSWLSLLMRSASQLHALANSTSGPVQFQPRMPRSPKSQLPFSCHGGKDVRLSQPSRSLDLQARSFLLGGASH
eukprot:1851921-Amphidinium_carterae.1